jgi:hypothetical protein
MNSITTSSTIVAVPTTANSVKLSPVGGTKTVTTSGTGVALAATVSVKMLYVRAKSTNTGNIYFGDSAVDVTTSKQIILTALQSVTIDTPLGNKIDVSEFFIDADVNGEGVDFLYLL